MGRTNARVGGTTGDMDADIAALNRLLQGARVPCTPIRESATEIAISTASLALFPQVFHMAGLMSLLDNLEEEKSAERRKSVHNRLVVCLYSKENIDFPLLQKLYSKERGRPTRAVEDMFLEMAGLVSTAMARIPHNKRKGVACGLMHDFGDIISRVEGTICLPMDLSHQQRRPLPPSTPIEPSTGPHWIPRLVQRAINRVAVNIGDPDDVLSTARSRFLNAVKQVCANVAILANLVRTKLHSAHRHGSATVSARAPVKRRHEDANPGHAVPGRRIKL